MVNICPICNDYVIDVQCPRMRPDGTHETCSVCTGPVAASGCPRHPNAAKPSNLAPAIEATKVEPKPITGFKSRKS